MGGEKRAVIENSRDIFYHFLVLQSAFTTQKPHSYCQFVPPLSHLCCVNHHNVMLLLHPCSSLGDGDRRPSMTLYNGGLTLRAFEAQLFLIADS